MVHLVTLKPILYGGIAAKISGVKAVVCAIAGLGSTFLVNTKFDRMRRAIIKRDYLVLKSKSSVISDDDDKLTTFEQIGRFENMLIPGSGVDLGDYLYVPGQLENSYIHVF